MLFSDYALNPNPTITLTKEQYNNLLEKIDEGFYKQSGFFPIGCNIICGSEYPKEKEPTVEEKIKAKKNKKPFYKQFDRLKKWEK